MPIKVRMIPHEKDVDAAAPSGIQKVVERYFHYLPRYGIELVKPTATSYDLLALHAGTFDGFLPSDPIVAHCHGLYWTDDNEADQWQHEGNKTVVEVIRHAHLVTVPSNWVAESFHRDMHLRPLVVPHGVDWPEWQGGENQGYILWNKNRATDACDPTPVNELAQRMPETRFISTYAAPRAPRNVRVTGTLPHETMRDLIKNASIYYASTKETFGIGTLEAMAAGVPVLGFDWGGTSDLVTHGRNGYLAAPGDYDDLVFGANYILKHRQRLSQNARDHASSFTWDETARMIARAYTDTLSRIRRGREITVVIPLYNKRETILRAVMSAIRQTRQPDNIIIVDNNSTDGSYEYIASLVDKLDAEVRVRLVRCPAQGVAHARNYGIALADTSNYICCLDADDEIEERFIETCQRALDADNSLAIAYTGITGVRPDGGRFLSAWPPQFDYEQFVVGRNQVPTCCLFRRAFWERSGGYRQRFAPNGAGAEDAEFWLRIGALGGNAKKVSEEGMFVYYLGGQVSGDVAYVEPNWRAGKPWIEDGRHPFASVAQPANGVAHLVRQYDQPLVSVIVPCGPGHADYLVDCLDSIEAQSNRQWEVVLVADVGDEEFRKIHALVQDAYPFVNLVWPARPPVGAGAARNLGVERARGPLLLFVDADDWLTPNALNLLLAGYAENPMTIVYGEYIGHAYIQDGNELAALRSRGRLLAYNEKTTEATVLYHGREFDCEKALLQPDARRPYIWNTVTSLVPKAFHRAIGGFDVKMESWEDWDYWLRMARHDMCFTQVDAPVLEYRFYTGTRRALANPTESGDDGRQLSAKLLSYMTMKYEGDKAMGCKSCGSSKRRHVPPPTSGMMAMTLNEGGTDKMSGEDFVWVTLNDGNEGSHRIVFQRYDYGYRSQGDRFKMRRDHALKDARVVIDGSPQANPVAEMAVAGNVASKAVILPPSDKKPLPEAEVEENDDDAFEAQMVAARSTGPTIQDAFETQMVAMRSTGPAILEVPASNPPIVPKAQTDFTVVWGIGQERHDALARRGVRSLDGLIAMDVEGIRKALEVPEKTAQRILQSAQELAANKGI